MRWEEDGETCKHKALESASTTCTLLLRCTDADGKLFLCSFLLLVPFSLALPLPGAYLEEAPAPALVAAAVAASVPLIIQISRHGCTAVLSYFDDGD